MKKLLLVAWSTIFLAISVNKAVSFHGLAFKMGSERGSITIYFDPIDGSAEAWSYLSNPSGFLARAAAFARNNQAAIEKLETTFQVLVAVDENGHGQYVVESIGANGLAKAELELDSITPIDQTIFDKILCTAPINLSCRTGAKSTKRLTVVEGASDTSIARSVRANRPLITFGPLGAPSEQQLVVLDGASNSLRRRLIQRGPQETIEKSVKSGTIEDVFSAKAPLLFQPDTKDDDTAPKLSPRMRRGGNNQYRDIDRSGFAQGHELDERLKFIVIHCTAAAMSKSSIYKTTRYNSGSRRSRSKAHVYIMPDGELIELWPINTKPNTVLATKTELRSCGATRRDSLRTMYHIELNYACDYRPKRSPNPSNKQMEALAKIIASAFKTYGPFHITAHTYVDMGINSRFVHTDPQGRGGFDYARLWQMVESEGADLSTTVQVEPQFAKRYPISRGDIRHNYPPVMNTTLERETPSKKDDCRWRGK